MKKSIVISCGAASILALTAFGYMNWNDSISQQIEIPCSETVAFDSEFTNAIFKVEPVNLFYNIGNQFNNTVSRKTLHEANSITEILPDYSMRKVKYFQNVNITILKEEGNISIDGKDDQLNPAQVEMLRTTDYSSNIKVFAEFKRPNAEESSNVSIMDYYMTVVPEKQAQFTAGYETLIQYLEENTRKEAARVSQDQLKPGKLRFTVSKTGTISNVDLTSTCGYNSLDEALIELMRSMPGEWEPATNKQGEKVDQELVLFYGNQGC